MSHSRARILPAPSALSRARPGQNVTHLNARYRFENLVEGDHNRLARRACIAVAENPGKTAFNPLFIHGRTGLGKTHLLQALGNAVRANGSGARLCYVTAVDFLTGFVNMLETGQHGFRTFYSSLDVLILDDVQFLCGKERTREQFASIFNELHGRGRQLVLSADRSAAEMAGLGERLLSRLNGGLVAHLASPGLAARRAIVTHKAAELGLDLPTDAIDAVTSSITSSVRSLEAAVNRLAACAAFANARSSDDLVRLLSDLLDKPRPTIDVPQIIEEVARRHKMEAADVIGRSRRRSVVLARQEAMYVCCKLTPHTLVSLGRHFGGRDHSTVSHGRKATEDRMASDPRYAAEVRRLTDRLVPD